MTGYVTGELIDPDGADELLRTAAQSIPIAKRLGIPRLNLHGTGLDGQGLPVKPIEVVTGAMWLKARDTLARIADLGERHDVMFVLENLNAEVDHPGVPFGRAGDCLALVQAVDHPHLRLMLDLYHAQIGEGNLIELLRRAAPYIGEIQVADVPGRCEPGTGEINYPAVARALAAIGYRGTIGLEAFASATTSWRSPAFATPSLWEHLDARGSPFWAAAASGACTRAISRPIPAPSSSPSTTSRAAAAQSAASELGARAADSVDEILADPRSTPS